MAHRETSKRSKARTMLRLADLEQSKNAVLHSPGAASRDPLGAGRRVDARRLCAGIPRWACLRPHLSEMTDRMNKRLEDVKQSVRADELSRNSDNLQYFHSAFIGGL